MSVFGDYAKYYDLLYRDKDYEAETRFVLDALAKQGCVPQTVLDLGSGTGRHAMTLAARNVSVTGVDLSKLMVNMANDSKVPSLETDFPLPEFTVGDARTVRFGKKFDAVTALFHVMSYQTHEDDAAAVFATAREHLNKNGLFFFDFWYGPGVLNLRPEERNLHLKGESLSIHRHAMPELHVNDNIVDVNYTVTLVSKSGDTSELKEQHRMRYWFLPELKYIASQEGFTIETCGSWISYEGPDDSTWAAWAVVRLL